MRGFLPAAIFLFLAGAVLAESEPTAAERKTLLESFQRAQPPERQTIYDWTIRNIEARQRGAW